MSVVDANEMVEIAVLDEWPAIPTANQKATVDCSDSSLRIIHDYVQPHEGGQAGDSQCEPLWRQKASCGGHKGASRHRLTISFLRHTIPKPPNDGCCVNEWVDLEMDRKTEKKTSKCDALSEDCPQQSGDEDA